MSRYEMIGSMLCRAIPTEGMTEKELSDLIQEFAKHYFLGPDKEDIEFADLEGNLQTITWEEGDNSVGIQSGYVQVEND